MDNAVEFFSISIMLSAFPSRCRPGYSELSGDLTALLLQVMGGWRENLSETASSRKLNEASIEVQLSFWAWLKVLLRQ